MRRANPGTRNVRLARFVLLVLVMLAVGLLAGVLLRRIAGNRGEAAPPTPPARTVLVEKTVPGPEKTVETTVEKTVPAPEKTVETTVEKTVPVPEKTAPPATATATATATPTATASP
jgi:cytoskeletal protein RodZ